MNDNRQVVVIGSGPAGAAAAWALHRAGIAVTVLEAGREASARGLTVRAPGLTLLRHRHGLQGNPAGVDADGLSNWYFELSPGGLSNHWSGAVPRFAPEDFADGARLGEEHRWPVAYQDLAADYSAMERVLRVAGSGETVACLPSGEVSHHIGLAPDWSGVVAQAQARGHGLTSLPVAYGAAWTVTRSGTPFNSYVRLVDPIPRGPRFRVLFGARATRLEWAADKKRVTRVVYRDSKSGEEGSVDASAFVVAAGALNSPRLLLESRCADFPTGLGDREGLLGRFLHDHPLAKIIVDLKRPLSIHPSAYLTRAPYRTAPPLRGVGCILWSGTGARLRSLAHLTPDRSMQLGFNLFGTMSPTRDRGIELHPERKDADGVPEIKLRIRFDSDTTPMLEAARDRLLEMLEAAGHTPRVKLWEVHSPGTAVHFGGSIRMHASPRHGLLDGWNRLHCAPGVLVVDSSCFTTGPEKNPTLTAMALSSRACRKLAEDLRA
jgi:choline dehydrogenase-like flavoprotein